MNSNDHDIIYTRNHLQNKIASGSKDWSSYKFVMSKTGLGLGPSGEFTGSEEVKREVKAKDKNASKFFKAKLLNFKILDQLFRY